MKIILILFSIAMAINQPLFADEIEDFINKNHISEAESSSKTSDFESIQNQDSTTETKNKDAIGEILLQAMSLMGISYKWGGNTPETGMDCSGFIRYVFKKSMGIILPRTVADMAKIGKKIDNKNIQPGDLIFFNTLRGRRNSHIGMYIGNNQFIQSPHTGEKIQITEYNSYWRNHTNGIKRIVQEEGVDSSDGIINIQTFENVRNEALPSGYIKTKHRKKSLKNRLKKKNSSIKRTATRIKKKRR